MDSVILVPAQVLSASITATFVAQCALFIAILFLGTILIGDLLQRYLYLPTIAGQIVGGIILGPSVLNCAQWHLFHEPFVAHWNTGTLSFAPADLATFFVVLLSAVFTVGYLLWIAGHETDLNEMAHVGVVALVGGILGALLPIGMIVAAACVGILGSLSYASSVGLGLIFAATSVSIPVALLVSYNKMHLRSSKATLGAAIVDDIFAVILLSLFFVLLQQGFFGDTVVHGHHGHGVLHALFTMAGSLIAMVVVGKLVIKPFLVWIDRQQKSYLLTPLAHGIMLAFFALAELVGGLAGITGAYFAGIAHVLGDKRHTAFKQLSPYVNAILVPLFLGSIGLQVDISVLNLTQWMIVGIVLVCAVVSKLLGCYIATYVARWFGNEPWHPAETFLFGSSMVARGEVGLVVATIIRNADLITSEQYVMAVVGIVLTTIATPLLVCYGFNWLAKTVRGSKRSYVVSVGPFATLGTTQMFNTIVGFLERDQQKTFEIKLSEGRSMVHLEEHDVKIMVMPSNSIIFEGNQEYIVTLLKKLHDLLQVELGGLKAL